MSARYQWIANMDLRRGVRLFAVALSALTMLLWWMLTPPGLLGKADAVGYAVCHRIDLRSFHLDDRTLPLCARCSGMYLGALLGLTAMALAGRGRAGGLPPMRVGSVLLLFVAALAVDGTNSFLSLIPSAPHLYQPNNTLRLVTGTLHGLAMSAVLFPTFNQTLWRGWQDRSVLGNLRELAGLLALAALLVGMVLTENPIVLYPLALLSAAGVLALLVMVNTTLLLLITGRENRAHGWQEAALPLFLGLGIAILQIGAIDWVRYAVTGTWAGFSI